MISQRKLGIYWGDSGISLVELNKDVPVTSAFVSFADLERDPIVGIKNLSSDLRLLDLLQKALRGSSFSIANAFLSFPSKDIIARWFTIPWVKPEEIQGVVAFEAKKYIPFPLEELVFNYYPSTMSKDGSRQIGIALTAIRKTNYEQYTNVLIQAGINVVYSESSAMSQLRALAARKLINTDQITAVLSVRESSGEISIVSQGYVKFIRDFSFQSSQPNSAQDPMELLRSKLFNEVRMSLDFFSRNNAGPEVEKVIAISSGMHQPLFDTMGEDIGLPVQIVDPYQVLEKFNALPDIGYIRAFGAALSGAVPLVIDFNLSEDQTGVDKKKEKAKTSTLPLKALMVMGVVIVCLVLAVGSWRWTNEMISAKEMAKQEVAARLGRYLDVPIENIESKLNLLKKKIQAVKSVSLRSSLTPLMVRLVQLMPEAIWLDAIDINNKDDVNWNSRPVLTDRTGATVKKPGAGDYYSVNGMAAMTVSGMASLDDTNAEFELVNQFVETVMNDPQFKQAFKEIKLKTLQAKEGDKNKKITVFTIEFK